ncbi:hypothetical protein K4L44_00270 [Halosquirtibacter laminarini]|uniref:Uncharacterized protein n=1 Tax=Halosquirtibacter laminarini TaxID=3374600 RepID=A0AC61NNZ0_9BACT|nr:hypothetical protein K4L44_00270 [Prolixibacteraceae bacterium]
MSKIYLQITKCVVADNGSISTTGEPFQVMMNPDTISCSREISYPQQQVVGQSQPTKKFCRVSENNFSFKIVLDATGVVPGTYDSVADQIRKLTTLIAEYQGDKHSPNVVRVAWGESFKCNAVATKYDVSFTLFAPDGTPLRAVVDLSFSKYITAKQASTEAGRSSPDMTHYIEVKAGETLPMLCERIYGSSQFYLDIAKINHLTTFRNIKAGTKLLFPPLV